MGLLALYGVALAAAAGYLPWWLFASSAFAYAAWEVVAIAVFMEGSFEALLCRVFRYRDVALDGDLYLRRWFLTPRGWRWHLFLHHIHRADKGRALHDHPWPFLTIPLRGWYLQEAAVLNNRPGLPFRVVLFERTRWLIPAFRRAEYTHRIAEVSRGGCWTLVVVGQVRREWGFWTAEGWRSAVSLGIADKAEDKIRA